MSTEFTVVVDPDSGSGVDYSSLNAAEAGIQTDLTVATTLVFAHGGITGSLSDNDSLTGQTSGATGTLVHASSSQILIESISGTFQSGEQIYETENVNYVTSSDAGDDAIVDITGRCTGGTADTTTTTVNGSTTSATNYIKIRTDSGESYRHNGTYQTGNKYRLELTDAFALQIQDQYVRVEGIQVQITRTTGGSTAGIAINSLADAAGEIWISHNIVKNVGDNRSVGIFPSANIGATARTIKIWDNAVFDWTESGQVPSQIRVNSTTWSAYIYNNTVYGGYYGIRQSAGTLVAKNNIVQGSANNAYQGTFDAASDYNISDDATDPGGANDQNNVTLTFINLGGRNFHLDAGDTEAIGGGEDLDPDGDGFLNVTDDIDGDARDATNPDVGADEFVAVAAGVEIFRRRIEGY